MVVVLFSTVSAGNVSVNEIGTTYIIWNTENNITSFWLDGTLIPVYGSIYGQYDLSPDSVHTGCEVNGTCIQATTLNSGFNVLEYWIVFLILVVMCIVSYYIPVSYVFQVIYGIYLISTYLPSINAPFEQYLLTGLLMIFGMIAGIRGYTR